MSMPNPFDRAPALTRSGEVLTLGPNAARRFVFPVSGLAVLFVLGRDLPAPFFWVLAATAAAGLLGVDTWSFDLRSRTVRRRVGVVLLARSWGFPFDQVSDLRLSEALPPLASRPGMEAAPRDPAAALLGADRPGWHSLSLDLENGKCVTLAAVPPFAADKLEETAAALSEACGFYLSRS
jgi:hypothetical protein